MFKQNKMIKSGLILACLFIISVQSTVLANEVRALRTVVIDPGHGGHDPGAVSAGVREKDIVLDMALRLGKKIQARYPEVKVIYTRDKDVFIPLFERAEIANRNKADLFISLHANYVASPNASGTETFTLGLHRSQENLEVAKKENSVILLEEDYTANYEGFDPREAESYIMFENMQSEYQGQSIDFAAQIQDQFGKNLNLPDRGVKQAGFLVLRRAGMPSVLVEVGFISNPNERKYLLSETGKERVTESILQAFSTYKKYIDERSRFTLAQSDTRPPATSTPTRTTPESAANTSSHGNAGNGTQPKLQEQSAQPDAPNQTQSGAKKTPAVQSTAPKSVTPGVTKPAPSAQTATPQPKSGRWYAVQVAAVQRIIETTPANFKSEKNVSRLQVGNINKYVCGRFSTVEEARREKNRLAGKFPDAFVVMVENGIPTVVKN